MSWRRDIGPEKRISFEGIYERWFAADVPCVEYGSMLPFD